MKNTIRRNGGNGRRSTCVTHNGLLYTSGLTTTDLSADMTGQAQDIFEKLDRIMAYNNTNKHNILSATIYLSNMDEVGDFNAAWDLWIDDAFEPARTVVEARLALDEYRVKISLIVAVED